MISLSVAKPEEEAVRQVWLLEVLGTERRETLLLLPMKTACFFVSVLDVLLPSRVSVAVVLILFGVLVALVGVALIRWY